MLPDIIKITARKLRTNMTDAEKILWKELRRNKLFGKRILRQRPILVMGEDNGFKRYIIADFVCLEEKIIIEIDSSIHNIPHVEFLDREKEELLKNRGFQILRFTNNQVFQNINIVLGEIAACLQPSVFRMKEGDSEEDYSKKQSSCKSSPFQKGEDLQRKKGFIMKNESFLCENCGKEISKHPSGSARNHCPFCLYSKHLDKDFPGDRASECHSLMKPVGKDYHKNKGWIVIHQCQKCGKRIPNKLAEDDSVEVYGRL